MSVGTLVVALAALNYNGERKRDKARNAFLVLWCLVFSKSLPSTDTAENIATLLRLQGLRRISGLLCPRIFPLATPADDMQEGVLLLVFLKSACTDEDAHHVTRWWHVNCVACRPGQGVQLCPSAQTHSHVPANVVSNAEEPTSTMLTGAVLFTSVIVLAAWRLYGPASILSESRDPELVPQMQFMAQVAQLLVELVKVSAAQSGSTVLNHSSSSPAHGSNTLETHSQDANIRAPESTHAGTRSGMCAGSVSPSMTTETWATPTAAAWQEKSTIAMRALSTLHWLSKLIGQGVNPVAGHLLDPNVYVRTVISKGLHPLMHDWSSRGDTAKGLTFSILVPMFLRLAIDHEELLADEQAVQETSDMVVKPQQAAFVWQLIVGETKPEL